MNLEGFADMSQFPVIRVHQENLYGIRILIGHQEIFPGRVNGEISGRFSQYGLMLQDTQKTGYRI